MFGRQDALRPFFYDRFARLNDFWLAGVQSGPHGPEGPPADFRKNDATMILRADCSIIDQ